MTDPPAGGWGPPAPPPRGPEGPPPPPPGYPPPPPGYPGAQGYPPAQGYPQPGQGYPQPGGYGYYGPAPKAGTNGFAIASLVFGVIGGILLSVIFGVIALRQIKRRNQGGKGLAVAGLVLSFLWALVIGAAVLVLIASEAERDEGGQVVEGGSVSIFDLEVGDCLPDVREAAQLFRTDVVPCTDTHTAEVFAAYDIPGDVWPGLEAIEADAQQRCEMELSGYSTVAAQDPALELFYFHPTEQSWAQGDHAVACVAVTPPRTASLRP